jgi:hypothetical protein
MHVAFPFQVQGGTVTLVDSDAWVVGLIEQVLFTMPGERVDRPTFGCGVQQLVFQPDSPQLASAVQYLIKSELQRWLTGMIDISAIVVTNAGDQLQITISFVNLISGAPSQVTLPRKVVAP